MKIEEVIETQDKALEDIKKAFTKNVGEIPHSTELDTLIRLKKEFEANAAIIKEDPEHNIQAFYREQNGGKEYLTFHMNTKVQDAKNKCEFFNHYGKYNMPLFRQSRTDVEGRPIYDVEDTVTKYFIEFSKKNYEELKPLAEDVHLYIKTKKGLAYGPFSEGDWLNTKFDELVTSGQTGSVKVTNGKAD